MGGCESTISSPANLLYLEAEKCGNCCGERQCLLSCLVLRVCIWHRQAKSHSMLSLPRMLTVEIRPIGADFQAKRTGAGKRRRALGCQIKSSLNCGEETWIWEPQKKATQCTNRMTFRVPPSGQLGLNVLESPADWWHADASPDVLGEARIRIGDDILSVLDSEGHVDSGDIRKDLLQQTHLPTSAASTGVHGKLCHPLIMDKRVCGEIVLDLTVWFEDPVTECQEMAREFNLPHNPCGKAGAPTGFMKICQERTGLATGPPEDEVWSPRSLNCAATGSGVDGAL